MFVFHESEARKKNSRAISPGSFFFIINSDNSLPGGLAEQALCPACSAGTDNTSSLPLILSSQNNSLVRDVNFSRKSTPSALFFFPPLISKYSWPKAYERSWHFVFEGSMWKPSTKEYLMYLVPLVNMSRTRGYRPHDILNVTFHMINHVYITGHIYASYETYVKSEIWYG